MRSDQAIQPTVLATLAAFGVKASSLLISIACLVSVALADDFDVIKKITTL
jgi:hypothetical protein